MCQVLSSLFLYPVRGPCESRKMSKDADMEFVKNFTPSDFQEKKFTPSISPNFNGFSKKKHKKWRNLHRWQKFYTAAGTDGTDKFHLCFPIVSPSIIPPLIILQS